MRTVPSPGCGAERVRATRGTDALQKGGQGVLATLSGVSRRAEMVKNNTSKTCKSCLLPSTSKSHTK